MTESPRNSRLFLVLSGVAITLLLAAVITLGSLRVPFEPHAWDELITLYALNTFIVAALLVFGLILGRTLVRLWAERRAGQLGSRFKTKMVFGAMAVSLLPLIFMFFISYALMNRTPEPLVPALARGRQCPDQCPLGEVNPWNIRVFRRWQTVPQPRFPSRLSQPLIGPGTGRSFCRRSRGGRCLGTRFLRGSAEDRRSLEPAVRC